MYVEMYKPREMIEPVYRIYYYELDELIAGIYGDERYIESIALDQVNDTTLILEYDEDIFSFQALQNWFGDEKYHVKAYAKDFFNELVGIGILPYGTYIIDISW